MCKFTKNHLWIWQIGRFFIINRFCPKACVVIGYAISDVSLRLSGRIFLWEKYFLYYLCALKMNKPYTMNRKQILCISLLAFSLCACQDDDTADILDAFGTPPALTKMTAQEFLDQGEQMFEDGESVDEIVSADRAFYVNNPFNVSMADGKLRLFNGMAHDFKEVSLWLTMPHLRDTIQLMQFEEVPGFYNIKLDSPLKMGEVVYASKSGKPVRVNNLALLSPDQYELLLSCNDSVFDMLKTIKMKTRIQMGKYGSGNWGVMTANAARYYATSVVNMAVMFSSEIFRDSLMNYKGSIHNDAGKEIDREGLLNSILNKQSLVFGVVTGSGIAGLGGGNALGLREEYLAGFFYQNRVAIDCNWVLHVWIHELGHCLGYGHSSSLCYGSVPDEIVPKVYRYMMKHRMLPYIINPFKSYNDYNPGINDADNPDIEL
ncbi:hypothetical protein M074_1363 [Bacteroides fragilis str. DS-166]|uniref:hypothetical protein n=1 Tax=Bacteroides fragilis TaxID=817 RepID=UPI00045324AD|nr:hypothetical protein [Bacteroides fragilis]EXZ01394.1 hypothetical protein M074_1363 [Bacteroides fragilis str. DS-166]